MEARDEAQAARVVAFWREAGEERWFEPDPDFDAAFRNGFLDLHLAAARGDLDGYAATPEGSLALVLLLDQFPRNAFRGTPRMYASDALARRQARAAIEAGQDAAIAIPLRVFLYLPFAHSEDARDQALSVRLNRGLGGDRERHALGHQAIIARFGRFPHRNRLLGRETSPEERAFLDGGGFAG